MRPQLTTAPSSGPCLRSCCEVVKAGLPLPGVQVRIAARPRLSEHYTWLPMADGFQANPDNLDADMPRDQPGELLVRGPWIIQDTCVLVWSTCSTNMGAWAHGMLPERSSSETVV